ncbi:MAG: histidine--tRNA ligase [Enterobacterales bacterium]
MRKSIQSIRGTNDYLPKDVLLWQKTEKILTDVLYNYCIEEIRIPVIEYTELFTRSIGISNDVVCKEMYTFYDRSNKKITLRPEGTSGCIRACIKNGLLYNKEQRLWYIGPMFRYERPQKGRYRQFNQLGVEIFGTKNPIVDVDLIMLTIEWWKKLRITDNLFLEINSLGNLESRMNYKKDLIKFFCKNKNYLDENTQQHIYTNPIRILDSKNEKTKSLLNDAPSIINYLDDESNIYFNTICKYLNKLKVSYVINSKLVRGLDYYNSTIFEWKTNNLGSQKTVCGGGRYDNLVKYLGGISTPAVGLAIGLDRLMLLIKQINNNYLDSTYIDIYIICTKSTQSYALFLSQNIRKKLKNIRLILNYYSNCIKKQIKLANKYNSRVVLILTKEHILNDLITVKDLSTKNEENIKQKNLINNLIEKFDNKLNN